MNYTKIYNDLIFKAINRKFVEGYTEKHHILPKCLGGDNHKSNIVILTGREHYIAHFLLVKIYPKNAKLKYALWMMVNGSRIKRPKVNSRLFQIAKEEFVSAPRQIRENYRHSRQTLEKMRKITTDRLKIFNVWKEKKHKESSKKLMQMKKIGRILTKETVMKMKASKIGKKNTTEHNLNISKAKLGDKNPMFGKTGKLHFNSKKVLQKNSITKELIKVWDSLSDIDREFKLNKGYVSGKLKKNQNNFKNYYWEYAP